MDRQSEWITLRRVYAFLKSHNLPATARALEQEARLKFDYPRVRALFRRGRWRCADEYVSAFLGDSGTPEASAALLVARHERLVRALRRGDRRAWAMRFFRRRVEPLLASLHGRPNGAGARTGCLRALAASPGWLRRNQPDDAESREECVMSFTCYIRFCERPLHRCTKSFVHDRFSRFKSDGTLGLRRHARPR